MSSGGHVLDPILEYIENMRALLRQKPELFGLMVERQIQGRLLGKIAGSRATLEPSLWALLIFCVDGHEAGVPALDDAAYQQLGAMVETGSDSSGQGRAAYPVAARAVMATLTTLREGGVYPPRRT